MAKKYSSFKQQQSITENFRRYMNEEGEEDTFYFAERDGVPSEPFQKKKFGGDRKTFAEYILKSQGLPTFNVYEGDPADHEEKPPLSIYQVIGGKLAGNPQTPEDEEYSLVRRDGPKGGYGDDVSGYIPSSHEELDDEQKKKQEMKTYWGSRVKAGEDVMQMDLFHLEVKELGLDPWDVYKKLKAAARAAQVQKENKVHLRKRQLQNIIKEEIKKVMTVRILR